MKKHILSAMATVLFTSTIAIADEIFIGGGYDFNRKSSEENIKNKKLKQGIKIKAEWMPFEKDNLKAGFGISHNFNNERKSGSLKLGSMTPVYTVFKPECKINDEWKIFNKYKAGWSFNSKKNNENLKKENRNFKFKSAPYLGIGIGTEWKNFSVEISYEINYISNRSSAVHQMGITMGYAFNKRKSYKLTEVSYEENIKKSDIQNPKSPSLKTESLDTTDTNDDKEKNIKKDKRKEYWKWFSFDEEINK